MTLLTIGGPDKGGLAPITPDSSTLLFRPAGVADIPAANTPSAQPVPFNQAGGKLQLREGSNVIALKAYVQGEEQAIADKTIGRGRFSAVATFQLDYE
ncbi:hypothetical protein [Serratia sp. NA_13]|uniref:hypothetical protein n=1 Tax=Serratia sp. NA_13 TaxID=3415658 RepID=UPI004046D63F